MHQALAVDASSRPTTRTDTVAAHAVVRRAGLVADTVVLPATVQQATVQAAIVQRVTVQRPSILPLRV